jgi:hypothetical protein
MLEIRHHASEVIEYSMTVANPPSIPMTLPTISNLRERASRGVRIVDHPQFHIPRTRRNKIISPSSSSSSSLSHVVSAARGSFGWIIARGIPLALLFLRKRSSRLIFDQTRNRPTCLTYLMYSVIDELIMYATSSGSVGYQVMSRRVSSRYYCS